MLRHLGEDIKNKSYAHRASELVYSDTKLLLKVRGFLKKRRHPASDSVKSALRSGNTATIHLTSRAAASELNILRSGILKALEGMGVTTLRFTA
ncbi:MAG: hypothetical protein HYT40_00470 [Candidatus Sungbacteria bacterium]|uniref:Uncharacterized protein n=1 Tax=Candidatus Sungiibacteriota bacterium TaxID=2750080 RepID=A0A931SAZ2_9BACT|nr:hypothetical protein [Candidatus Sungbacteria bacterium]